MLENTAFPWWAISLDHQIAILPTHEYHTGQSRVLMDCLLPSFDLYKIIGDFASSILSEASADGDSLCPALLTATTNTSYGCIPPNSPVSRQTINANVNRWANVE
jgi:hypothetical protein